MKSTTRHTGTLTILRREKNSIAGNPRYLVNLDGWTALTVPNSSEAYGIENYAGKRVTAELGTLRGKTHIRNITRA